MSTFADTQMSPGRRILLLLTVLAGLAAGGLSVWQLRRLIDRRTWNAHAMAARDKPEVDLTTGSLEPGANYRRVRVTGRYDFDHEVALRGRLFQGTPGIHVITPLRLAGRDSAVLVHRGFVPTSDAGMPSSRAAFAETETTTFSGVALAVPDAGDGQPLETTNGRTWHRLDLSALRREIPYPVAPYYVIVIADSDRTREHTIKGHSLPIRIDPPPLDNGTHLSYAIQWFLIGGASLGFGLFFVRRRPGPSVGPA